MKIFIYVLFIFAFVISLQAQEEAGACADDINKYCKGEKAKGFKEVVICLNKNHKKLNLKCRQDIERRIKGQIQSKPSTGMLFSGAGGLGGRLGFIPMLRYQGELSGKIKSNNTSSETQIIRHRIEGSIPIAKVGKGFISSSLRYGKTSFDKNIILNSGVEVNKELQQFELGINYNRPFKDKTNINVRARYGYRGERIGGSDYNYSLMTGYSHPTSSGKGRWQYFLMFSNNGPLGNNIPIPGFMYFYRTATMNIIFGLPIFSLQWNPENSLIGISVSAFGPFYNFEISYALVDEVQYFLFTRWKQENFILSHRSEEEDRLNIYEKISGAGVRSAIFDNSIGVELRAGYSNDRKLYFGDGLFNNDKGSKDLNDSMFIKVMLSKAFR